MAPPGTSVYTPTSLDNVFTATGLLRGGRLVTQGVHRRAIRGPTVQTSPHYLAEAKDLGQRCVERMGFTSQALVFGGVGS